MIKHVAIALMAIPLIALSGAPVRAGEPGESETGSDCLAADLLRSLHPGLVSEGELAYYSLASCARLESILEQADSLDSSAYDQPVASDEECESSGMDMGAVDSEEAANYFDCQNDAMGKGVAPPLTAPAVDRELVAMQNQYVALGCAEKPESEECLSSEYAKRLMKENGGIDGW